MNALALPSDEAPDKATLRRAVVASRTAMRDEDRERDRAAIREAVLERLSANVRRGARIAAYEPMRTEPGSNELLRELTSVGFEVLVPVRLADNDLDWALWRTGGQTVAGQIPARLGTDAVSTVSAVLVPAFAVDGLGRRLGRGGGSYDRALQRVAAGIPVAALLFADEVVRAVPVDEWDRPVSAVVTPAGWRDLHD
jgi:5-formyltetrahydrofolate cyclo-ligase